MSAGLHRLWKRYAVLQAGLRPGMQVLDVAGGTADLTRLFLKQVGETGQVVLTDINFSMLREGRDRMLNEGRHPPTAQCDGEKLPFPDNIFDCVSVAFGLRNMTDKDRALKEMHRVLKPGGRLLVLEFSKVWKPLAPLYDAYSFQVLPRIGKLVAGDESSYRYLAESIRMHPDQETLKSMMEDAGFFKVDYANLTGGVVALHKGYKV
jgi:demethylmenaquinone methyltransferase/2-methoxy-6-polyprenyl-1,4-benzoquinol methylase